MDIYKVYMPVLLNEQLFEVLMMEHDHSLVLLNSEGVRYSWQTKLLLASLPLEPHASRSLLLTILICPCVQLAYPLHPYRFNNQSSVRYIWLQHRTYIFTELLLSCFILNVWCPHLIIAVTFSLYESLFVYVLLKQLWMRTSVYACIYAWTASFLHRLTKYSGCVNLHHCCFRTEQKC
jgi:hypothetical protein